MNQQEDQSAKIFDPTPQKLQDARKRGEVAKSTDIVTASAYAGLLIALIMFWPSAMDELGKGLTVALDQASELAPLIFDGAPQAVMAGIMQPVLSGLTPLFLGPAAAALLAIFAQRALVFAPSKLQPKLSRISPVSNAKNKFGRQGLFEWAKSFSKLLIYSAVLGVFISLRLTDMIAAVQSEPRLVLVLLAELCVAFLLVVVLVSGGIGVLDAVWQHAEHIRQNRMSHKEMQDETKQAEGDPHLKQERRQRALATAQNQMMAQVPSADVVIVNPIHYAVALIWSRAPGDAPVVVAKGIDEMAKAIREVAQSNGVPIHPDPPTARSLHATSEIGQQIRPDFYAAVATAIRFAEEMRIRAKRQI